MAIGIGVSPVFFCGLLNPVLLDIDFTTLAAGGVSPPTGVLTPCASAARTVQTGKSTVSSGIAANLALVGREQDWWDKGLVVEGPVVNACPSPRVMTPGGVLQSGNATFTEQSAGTDSPDGTVNSPISSNAATQASRYLNGPANSKSVMTFWRRQYAQSPRRAALFDGALVQTPATAETGNVSVSWEKSVQFATWLVSATPNAIPLYGNGVAATGYGIAAICSARFDMLQYETNTTISHEFYDGTKLGAGLTFDATKVVAGGRLSIRVYGRPKGSINGNNPWTYNPYIVYGDANNNVIFNATTGVVTVTVAGSAYSCPVPINFNRASLVDIWIEAGGGSLQTVVRAMVDGIMTTLGTSPAPQGTWPATGTLGVCCKPSDLTTGQFESWVYRVTFMSPGSRPTLFAADPYQLFYDFTGLALGAPATPAGLTFACATAGRTVQTSDSTVASGIAANAIRVGRENSKWLPGLVLEGVVTNQIGGGRNPVAGTGGIAVGSGETWVAQGVGTNSPDGTVNSPSTSIAAGSYSRYATFASLAINPVTAYMWIKGSTARRSALGAGTLYPDSGTATNAWEKRSFANKTGSSNGVLLVPADGRIANGFTVTAAAAYGVDFMQLESANVPHEFIDGTKAAETLSVPVASAVVNGRLGFYCRFRPKFSSASGTNPSATDQCLWYIDANNRLDWTSTGARTLILTVAGAAYTSTNTMPTMARGEDWSLWVEAGAGVTVAWVYNHGTGITYPITFPPTVLPEITGTTLNLLSTPTGTLPTEGWHATARTYKTGRPDWQDPNILWRADFRRLQAGTDTTPAGMTVTCATTARTVQVGTSQVVSGIGADVLLIGRESDAWNLGAVLEGAVSNSAANPRALNLWNGGSGGESFTPSAAGVGSPDNTVTAAQIAVTGGNYSRLTTAPTGTCNAFFWRKGITAARERRGALYRTNNSGYSNETGNTDTTKWEKAQFYLSAGTGTTVLIFAYGANAPATNGYATNVPTDGYFDFAQVDNSGLVAHEFVVTSKLGTVHSVPAATVVSAGRLSLHYAMRPKGSIGGTNPWTTAVYLWRIDGDNSCLINANGTITSKTDGDARTSTAAVSFARGDRLEWWYAGGGGALATVIKLRVNGGAIQTITLAVQGTVPNSGSVGLGCDPAAPSTGSLEGTYEYIEAYRTGTAVAWAA